MVNIRAGDSSGFREPFACLFELASRLEKLLEKVHLLLYSMRQQSLVH